MASGRVGSSFKGSVVRDPNAPLEGHAPPWYGEAQAKLFYMSNNSPFLANPTRTHKLGPLGLLGTHSVAISSSIGSRSIVSVMAFTSGSVAWINTRPGRGRRVR